MKRVIALLVVCMFLVGCTAAFAQQTQEQGAVSKIGSAIKKFFNDLGDLLTKKIPETPQQKSSRQPWDDLVKQKSAQ